MENIEKKNKEFVVLLPAGFVTPSETVLCYCIDIDTHGNLLLKDTCYEVIAIFPKGSAVIDNEFIR